MQAEILRKTKFVNFSFPLGGGLTRDVHLAVTGVSTTSCTDASAGCSPQYAAAQRELCSSNKQHPTHHPTLYPSLLHTLHRYDGSAMFHTSECDVGYYYHNGNIMIGFYRVENTVI